MVSGSLVLSSAVNVFSSLHAEVLVEIYFEARPFLGRVSWWAFVIVGKRLVEAG